MTDRYNYRYFINEEVKDKEVKTQLGSVQCY